MTITAKLKQLVHDWRLHVQNYLGSLGYYLLFLAVVLIVIRLFMQLSQYVIYSYSSSSLELSKPVSEAAYTPGLLENLIAYSISLVMAVVTLVIILLIPYLFGYVSSRACRAVLNMTSFKPTFKNLFKLKYAYSLLVLGLDLLLVYDYGLAVESNWYAILLIGLSLLALGLFWLQSLLVKIWKIKISQVY